MPFRLLVGLIFLLIVIAAEPSVVLFVLTFGYVASGPITTLYDRRRRTMSVKSGHKGERKEARDSGHSR
jgi:hypothetical protein